MKRKGRRGSRWYFSTIRRNSLRGITAPIACWLAISRVRRNLRWRRDFFLFDLFFFFFFLISKLRSNLNDFDRLNECRSTRMEFESNRSYFFICVIIFCRFGVCKSNPLKTLRCKCYFLKFILEIYYLENRFDDWNYWHMNTTNSLLFPFGYILDIFWTECTRRAKYSKCDNYIREILLLQSPISISIIT